MLIHFANPPRGFGNHRLRGQVLDVIIKWLSTDEVNLNQIDAEDPDITDYHYLPNTKELASKRLCFFSFSMII